MKKNRHRKQAFRAIQKVFKNNGVDICSPLPPISMFPSLAEQISWAEDVKEKLKNRFQMDSSVAVELQEALEITQEMIEITKQTESVGADFVNEEYKLAIETRSKIMNLINDLANEIAEESEAAKSERTKARRICNYIRGKSAKGIDSETATSIDKIDPAALNKLLIAGEKRLSCRTPMLDYFPHQDDDRIRALKFLEKMELHKLLMDNAEEAIKT